MLAPAGARGFLGIRPIVWVGIMLAVFQQLVGINVIFYYGATLWQLAGFTENDSLLINIVSGAVSIAACFVTIAADRQDRPQAAAADRLGGHGGDPVRDGLCLQPRARSIRQGKLVLSADLGTIAVVAANLYVIFFNVSAGAR